jgi:transcriptional regulator with XRE-family HTH domain
VAVATTSLIAERRKARGLTQRQLGRLAGVSHIKIHYYEHGLRPSTLHLIRIADALHCQPEDLEARDE